MALCFVSFVAGFALRAPSPSTASSSAELTDAATPLDPLARPVADGAALNATDAVPPDAQELSLATGEVELGAISPFNMTASQWDEYLRTFLSRNPGVEQLEGLAALLGEELQHAPPALGADPAMKAALARAARRWITQQAWQALQSGDVGSAEIPRGANTALDATALDEEQNVAVDVDTPQNPSAALGEVSGPP